MNILVINGPNLNLLGSREPEIYGHETLDEIMRWLADQPEARGHSLEYFQSNHEGAIIDRIHQALGQADGILINPGAYTHYSYAIRDALVAVELPTVEVHLSDITARESFRRTSVIKDICITQVTGLGKESYQIGLKYLIMALIESSN